MRTVIGAVVGLAALAAMSLPAHALPLFDNITDNATTQWVSSTTGLLNVGETVYNDRSYTFSGVPASLLGAERIITANATKGGSFGSYQITVDVLAPANLFLYIDDRIDVAASMGWVASQGWTPTADDLTTLEGSTTRTYSIFTQMVGAETIMTFEQSGASMYGMAGIPKPITQDETTTSIPEPGSLLLLLMGLGGIGFGVWYRYHARRDAVRLESGRRERKH